MKKIPLFLCIFGLFLMPNVVSADILALYEFDQGPTAADNDVFVDANNFQRNTSRDNNADVTARAYNTRTNIDANQVVGPSLGGVASPQLDDHAFARPSQTTNTIDSLSNNAYHEFSVQIDNGTWTIDSIHYQYWVNGTNAGDNSVFRTTVYSDLVGYAPGDELGTFQFQHTNQNPPIQTVSFNNLHTNPAFNQAFQQLGPGTVATFRIVFSDDVDSGPSNHRIDDVELRGFQNAVAVPEPSSLITLALVGGLMVVRRRRA